MANKLRKLVCDFIGQMTAGASETERAEAREMLRRINAAKPAPRFARRQKRKETNR